MRESEGISNHFKTGQRAAVSPLSCCNSSPFTTNPIGDGIAKVSHLATYTEDKM
jgi:hypothetical protein